MIAQRSATRLFGAMTTAQQATQHLPATDTRRPRSQLTSVDACLTQMSEIGHSPTVMSSAATDRQKRKRDFGDTDAALGGMRRNSLGRAILGSDVPRKFQHSFAVVRDSGRQFNCETPATDRIMLVTTWCFHWLVAKTRAIKPRQLFGQLHGLSRCQSEIGQELFGSNRRPQHRTHHFRHRALRQAT